MKIEIIPFTIEQKAINFQKSLFQAMKPPISPKGTKAYSNIIKHNSQDILGVQVVVDGNYWENVKPVMTQQQLDSIEEITPDWFEEID